MSSSNAARAGVLLGALAVAAIPAGVAAAWYSASLALVRALEIAVPAAFVLGLAAAAVVRRARYRLERSVARHGERTVTVARLLAWSGLYVGATGAIALGFYGLLVLRG
jgi:hypothetical protein